MIAARIRLLRLLARAGAGLATLLVVLQTIRAVIPVALALAVGGLVAARSAGRSRRWASGSGWPWPVR